MGLTAGARLGPYEVIAPVGAGGMGEVYRARDARLGRDVAIKVLPPSFADDANRRARFEREARAVAALSHPNIVNIYDTGVQDGHPFVVMELLDGETLRDLLRPTHGGKGEETALAVRKAIEIAVQIARGLGAAHEKQIVHRDLKPENIFIARDGQVKILDFGLARDIAVNNAEATVTRAAITDAGIAMGTVGYMAPEQIRAQDVDGRTDLFAFGAVLFEMIAGRRAFERETAADTMTAILKEDAPDLAGMTAPIPPSLDRIIRHCLEKNPAERFQSARDVAFALSALSGSGSGALAGVSAAVPPGARPTRSRGWFMTALVGVVALVAGVVIDRALARPAPLPEFSQRTFDSLVVYNARFMPDHQSIVFSAALAGNAPSLFESRPDGGAPRPFGPPRTHLLSVSASGELAVLTQAAFIHQRLFTGTLARMAMDGAPRDVASGVREADWLPDGTDLAVVREVNGGDQLEFPIGHIVYRTAGYLSDPRVSPDGQRVAFMEHPERFDDRGTVDVVDRAGHARTITGEYTGEEGLVWTRDGRTILFAGGYPTYQISTVPADGGGAAATLVTTDGSMFLHDITPDGRVAVTREDSRFGVIARGAGQDAPRELSLLDQSWVPALSSDGRFVAFSDGRTDRDYGAVMRDVDGSPPVRLGHGNVWSVSTDRRWVTANLFSTGRCVAYPTGVGAMVAIENGPLEHCVRATFFPDGKSVLIVGNEPGKPTRAYRATFPGGTPQALLPEGVEPFLIAGNGQRVLARTHEGEWQIWDLAGRSTPTRGLLATDTAIEWSGDEQSVLVSSQADIPAVVNRIALDSGQRTKVGELAPVDRVGVLLVRVQAFRDGGRQYAYDYHRRLSTLFVMTMAR